MINSYGNLFAKFLTALIFVCVSRACYADGIVGKIESAQPVSGVVTGSGVDRYTFPVLHGKTFIVSVSEKGEHTPGFTPSLKIIGPDNKVADSGAQTFYYHIVRVFPAGGTWTVEVGRKDGETGGGAYELRLITVADVKAAQLNYGQSVTGSISRGAVDVYFIWTGFHATGKLTLTAKDGHGFLPEAKVLGYGIDNEGDVSCVDSCSADLKLVGPGPHRIAVWRKDLEDSKGTYTLSVTGDDGMAPPVTAGAAPPPPGAAGPVGFAAAPPPAFLNARPPPLVAAQPPGVVIQPPVFAGPVVNARGQIENGKTVNGVLKGTATDNYTFKVSKGSSFIVTAGETGNHVAGFTPSLEVIGPGKEVVEGQGQALFSRVMGLEPTEGTWTARIHRFDQSETGGSYELKLLQIPGAKGAPIKFGKLYNGVIVGSTVDVYTIAGTPDVKAQVSLLPPKSSNSFFEMTIFAPNGAMVDGGEVKGRRDLKVSMTEFGNYTVTVSQSNTNDVKEGYSLFVKRSDAPDPVATAPASAVSAGAGAGAAGSAPVATAQNAAPKEAISGGAAPAVAGAETEEQKAKEIASVFINEIDPVFPARLTVPRRLPGIYLGGLFVTFDPIWSEPKDPAAPRDGKYYETRNPLMQLHLGDRNMHLSGLKAAVGWWSKAAAQGNADARNRLGAAYAQGYKDPGDKDKKPEAAAWYRLVLAQAHADPEIDQANAYLTGIGAVLDFAKAVALYRKLAEKGSMAAQFNLAALEELGPGAPPDSADAAKWAEAVKWYAKAASQGGIVAQNNLGELYEHGQGVAQDYAQAITLYQKAAASGYPPALYNLGRLAAEGRGMPKDAAKAADWLRKAASEGHVDAQGALDDLEGRKAAAVELWRKTAADGDKVSLRKIIETYRKDGIPPGDEGKILEMYRNAADEIDPVAFTGLADLFSKQDPPDETEAYFWYRLVLDSAKDAYLPPDEKKALIDYASTEAGKAEKKLSPEQIAVTKWRINDRHPLPQDKAQEAAAEIYLQGNKAMTNGDGTGAMIFYFQAARRNIAAAQYWLGYFFERGTGAPRDIDRAIGLYKQAILNGEVAPATNIGNLYQYGIGVPRDLDEAAKWYEMDASRGYKKAIDRLGWIYLYGQKGSEKKAIAMYEKAAARDVVEANNALGMIYLYGMGVPKDPGKALAWYLKSADHGHTTGAIQASATLKDEEPHDYGRALSLLRTFLSPVVLNNMAYMYEHGLGVKEQKYVEGETRPTALDLYKRAADMCYDRAMYNLGRLFDTGATAPEISAKPVEKNAALARRWMEAAALSGSEAAAAWLEARNLDSIHLTGQPPQEETGSPPVPCPEQGKTQ